VVSTKVPYSLCRLEIHCISSRPSIMRGQARTPESFLGLFLTVYCSHIQADRTTHYVTHKDTVLMCVHQSEAHHAWAPKRWNSPLMTVYLQSSTFPHTHSAFLLFPSALHSCCFLIDGSSPEPCWSPIPSSLNMSYMTCTTRC